MQKREGARIKLDDTFKEDSREGGCENGRHMELAQDNAHLRALLLQKATLRIALLDC
jgi:hypothetical protein